jgi:carbamoyl-phosphate synthase large subunit
MLEIGVDGLDPTRFEFPDIREELTRPSPRRIFAVARAFDEGMTIDEVAALTSIDQFFLAEIAGVVALRSGATNRDQGAMRTLKRAGFSDAAIARVWSTDASTVRDLRIQLDVRPHLAQIDTLAGEYPAETNYLYLTYAADAHDIAFKRAKKILVLGSGSYRIGSSVEFDWCCVNAAMAARESGFETLLLNCNPETVSTDYDICDRLVFDEISVETVLELCDVEKPAGVVVSMGGQTPNNLALKLHHAGVTILGTSPISIDRAEDREKFSSLCDELGIDQPKWALAKRMSDLAGIVRELGGFPVVVRPSYVLSGAAMRVAHGESELKEYLARATDVSPEHPVVISKFERHARELELDAVARDGEVVHWAISEHIEDAGVHSGDATLLLPPQDLYVETVRRARKIGALLARALHVTGPFNIQMLARRNEVKVIECNLRASRSFPFVSKVLGTNFVTESMRAMLGAPMAPARNPLDLDYVAVKAPQFSHRRLAGADPVLGVEMRSTGEAACFGEDADEALLKSLVATGFRFPKRGVLLSLGPVGDKYRFTDEALALASYGLRLYATPGTAEILHTESIPCETLDKGTMALEHMRRGEVDLVINVPREYDEKGRPDGYLIRRGAVDLEIPLITDLSVARKLVQALGRYRLEDLAARSWNSYVLRS